MNEPLVLEHGALRVTVGLDPFTLEIRRGGRRLIRGLGLWAAAGESRDQFIQLTEGVIPAEELERPRRLGAVGEANPAAAREARARPVHSLALGGDLGPLRLELYDERLLLELAAAPPAFRAGADWDARPGERLYAPIPWLLASRGYALWVETEGDGLELDLAHRISVSTRTAAGPFRLHVLTDPTPAARLRRFLRLTHGVPALLPEWAYGHWKSRGVYQHQRDVEDDFDGYRRGSASGTGAPVRRPPGVKGSSTAARCIAHSTRSTPAPACSSAGPAGPASRRSD